MARTCKVMLHVALTVDNCFYSFIVIDLPVVKVYFDGGGQFLKQLIQIPPN